MKPLAAEGPTIVASNLAPPPVANLRLLMVLRAIAVTGQVAAIVIATVLGVVLPLVPMFAVVALLVVLEAATWFRLRGPVPVSTSRSEFISRSTSLPSRRCSIFR